MAITGTDRGQGGNNTAGVTFALSPGSNFASATSWAALAVSADNAETGGVAHTTFAVTDDLGNTWTRRISPLYDPASTISGIEGAIFTTDQAAGILTTSTVITVTFAVSTAVKTWTLGEVTPTGGATISYVTGGVNAGAATTTPTVTTGTITSGNIVIAGAFIEYGTNQTITEDSDTTDGSWSTQQTAETGGTAAAGTSIATQRKVVTGTATQTYDPTLGILADVILGWIELTETGGAAAVLPMASLLLSAAVNRAGNF